MLEPFSCIQRLSYKDVRMDAIATRGINRRIAFDVDHSLISKFWSAVEKKSPEECWPWIRALRSGYGAVHHDGRLLSAQVISYRIHHGTIATGQVVLHSC